MQFIVRHVFEDVGWLNHEEILNRIEGIGALSRIQDIQATNLGSLLAPARLVRRSEAALVDLSAYSLVTFFEDLKNGVWSELDRAASVGTYRRSRQRSYLERLAFLMADPEAGENGRIANSSGSRGDGVSVLLSDIRPIVRAQLITLQEEASDAAEDVPDTMTRYHLEDIAARIEDILEG